MRYIALLTLAIMLSSCTPTLVAEKPQFTGKAEIKDEMLYITLINAGPTDLMLDPNSCPTPFLFSMKGALYRETPGVSFTCLAIYNSPATWRVGERQVAVGLGLLEAGNHTLHIQATPRVALLLNNKLQGAFKLIKVDIPDLTVTIPDSSQCCNESGQR